MIRSLGMPALLRVAPLPQAMNLTPITGASREGLPHLRANAVKSAVASVPPRHIQDATAAIELDVTAVENPAAQQLPAALNA